MARLRPEHITLSADERLIALARKKALARHLSLNDEFRAWLSSYVAESSGDGGYGTVMESLGTIEAGRSFSRDEANER